jgi:hemerythrin
MIWKEKYRIGVPLIDDQHQELFRRVTDFVTTLRSEGKWEEKLKKVNETLLFMKDYVINSVNWIRNSWRNLKNPSKKSVRDIRKI